MATVAMLGVLAILVAACGGEVETTPQPTAATTTTSATTTSTAPATTAPATSQDVLLTFDGEQCTYEGPSEGVLSEPLSLKLINNSDVFAFGVVLWVPPDLLEEVMPTVGTDFPFSEEGTGLTDTFYVEVQPRTEVSTSVFVATPGTYVLECVSAEGATMVHIWRPLAIEFSP
jgi:hypothetical protein